MILQYEPFKPPGTPTAHELRMLQSIVALTAERGAPPHMSHVGKDVGLATRQGVYHWVKKMRKKGLLEEPEVAGSKVGLVLTHNGLLAVATAMGAELP